MPVNFCNLSPHQFCKTMCKYAFIAVLMFCSVLESFAQNTPRYNKKLADSLGADAYGMKNYILVILKTGPAVLADAKKRDSLFNGHMANMLAMAAENRLVVAGPLGENSFQYRGIFILNTPSKEVAAAWLQSDPAIAAKVLAAELFQWYGSAALPVYLPYHEQIQKDHF